MLKNHLFFFKRYFDFFKNKYLAPGLMLLVMFLSICCFFVLSKSKLLSVPHITWQHSGWCGAACIQMWAYYEKVYPTQTEIAEYIGWEGSNVCDIAEGVSRFTSRIGFECLFYNSSNQQDAAVAAQVAAIKSEAPSISIVKNGSHAIIVIGFEWTELWGGTPRADFITFNDPAELDTYRVGAWTWKSHYFSPNPFSDKYEIVLSSPSFVVDGEEGHREFIARGGTYYGDPGDKGPKDPIEK